MKFRTFVTISSNLLKHCLAVHVIMSEHAILELINKISNSFAYGIFTLGIFIIYFSKVLGTYPHYIVHHAILFNKLNQWYKK